MLKGFIGKIFDFDSNTRVEDVVAGHRYFEDGLLVVNNGLVTACGDRNTILKNMDEDVEVTDFGGSYILPGFIDAHVHSVQTKAIASHGNQLLDWLEKFVFPNEKKFADSDYAARHTAFFFDQLLRNGTTTALIYPSVHNASVEAVFETATRLNMRVISGKTWMDRNAPAYLVEPAQTSYDASKAQIEQWHGNGRLSYAVTPRYAITSSPASLELAAALFHEFEGLYLQTHISENRKEIEIVNQSYSNHKGYLDVYDSYGLLAPRTLLGHGIHLTRDELLSISKAGASVVHCPSSNLFLGSGLFDFRKTLDHGVRIAVGSDVGGGASFSMLSNLHDAYKISALVANDRRNDSGDDFSSLDPLQAFYFITLGGARALKLDDKIGNFDTGKEADFVIINPAMNPLLNYRISDADSIEETLFALMMLGDEKVIQATYIMGEQRFNAANLPCD